MMRNFCFISFMYLLMFGLPCCLFCCKIMLSKVLMKKDSFINTVLLFNYFIVLFLMQYFTCFHHLKINK